LAEFDCLRRRRYSSVTRCIHPQWNTLSFTRLCCDMTHLLRRRSRTNVLLKACTCAAKLCRCPTCIQQVTQSIQVRSVHRAKKHNH